MALGVLSILGAFGVVPVTVAPDLRGSEWVIVCAGVSMLLIGFAFIVGLTARSSTWIPPRIQLIQLMLIGVGVSGARKVISSYRRSRRGDL
jgi:hypothetical protein